MLFLRDCQPSRCPLFQCDFVSTRESLSLEVALEWQGYLIVEIV